MVHPVFLNERSSSQSAGQRDPNDLIVAHHYLCRRGARKFLRPGVERCDLEQVAAIGLVKAARRYDAAVRTPFEAFAWLLIVGELMHYVRDHERPVRIPRGLRRLEARAQRARDACLARLGREPSDAELAGELGVFVGAIHDLRRAACSARPMPLDEIDGAHVRPSQALSPEDRFLVDEAFAALGQLERRIIVGVYLLGLPQVELSRRLGIAPRRVSRLHHAALRRMQQSWSR